MNNVRTNHTTIQVSRMITVIHIEVLGNFDNRIYITAHMLYIDFQDTVIGFQNSELMYSSEYEWAENWFTFLS